VTSPGWYRDPLHEAADQVRWWDGQRWTQHAQQLPTRLSTRVPGSQGQPGTSESSRGDSNALDGAMLVNQNLNRQPTPDPSIGHSTRVMHPPRGRAGASMGLPAVPTPVDSTVTWRHEGSVQGRRWLSLGLVVLGIGAALVPLLPVVSVPLLGGLVVGYGSWSGACLLCLGLASVVTGALTALDRLRGKALPIAASVLAVLLVAAGVYGLVTVEQAKQRALTEDAGVYGELISASVRYGSGLIVLLIVGVVALFVAGWSWFLARSEDMKEINGIGHSRM